MLLITMIHDRYHQPNHYLPAPGPMIKTNVLFLHNKWSNCFDILAKRMHIILGADELQLMIIFESHVLKYIPCHTHKYHEWLLRLFPMSNKASNKLGAIEVSSLS